MGKLRYARDFPIDGEVWRSTPCGLASVSDQGRLKSLAGVLYEAYRPHPEESERWTVVHNGTRRQYGPAVLVAHIFLGGTLGPHAQVGYKNGDDRDWRASNLVIPWSEADDRAILESESCRAAAAAVRRGRYAVRTRAKALGKTWPRTMTATRPLEERLKPAMDAIAVLEAAGVCDRQINLALRIDDRKTIGWSGAAIDPDAQANCIRVLHAAGWPPGDIAKAFGWVKGAPTARQKLRALGLIEGSGWDGTKAGLPHHLDGEEWLEHSSGYWVSSFGRVAGPKGLLSRDRRPGYAPRVTLSCRDGSKRHTSRLVAGLMLEAFRPGLAYSRKLFINGDQNDVRLSNIRVTLDPQATLAEIRKFAPGNWPEADRREIEQFALVAMMDGSALTPQSAIASAKRQFREMTGAFKSWSLDEVREGGTATIDRLSSDGTFIDNGRV